MVGLKLKVTKTTSPIFLETGMDSFLSADDVQATS